MPDPSCTSCGHPLWAAQSVEAGVCAKCDPRSIKGYDGPPRLIVTQGKHDRIGT